MHILRDYTFLRLKIQSGPVENGGTGLWIEKNLSTGPFGAPPFLHGPEPGPQGRMARRQAADPGLIHIFPWTDTPFCAENRRKQGISRDLV